MVYFDNAATTPVDEEVLEEMLPFFSKVYGNPSSVYALGRQSKGVVENVRSEISSFLKCKASEIFFVSSATEGHNTVFYDLPSTGIKTVITSYLEHAAVLNPLKINKDVELYFVRNDAKGILDLNHLEELLQTHPNALVSLMHVNNELGNINDVQEIASLCKSYGAKFHCDIVQSIGHLPLDISLFDTAVGSAHKFHGPKGIGFLYVKSGNSIPSMISGGKQESNFRAGTENVPGIVGMGKAISLIQKKIILYQEHLMDLNSYFMKKIDDELPMITLNGSSDRSAHIVSLSIDSPKLNKMFLFNLDMKGFCLSGGSACSSGAVKSHVAEAIGIPNNIGYVRVSFSRYNSREEIDRLVSCFKDML